MLIKGSLNVFKCFLIVFNVFKCYNFPSFLGGGSKDSLPLVGKTIYNGSDYMSDGNQTNNVPSVRSEIAKVEYDGSDFKPIYVDQRSLHVIIEQSNGDKIANMKELMEADLSYKKELAKIHNDSIENNPVFRMDRDNEKTRRIMTYIMPVIILSAMFGMTVSSPIVMPFLGLIGIISVIGVVFNTKMTTGDKRMFAGLISLLAEKVTSEKRSNKSQNRSRK